MYARAVLLESRFAIHLMMSFSTPFSARIFTMLLIAAFEKAPLMSKKTANVNCFTSSALSILKVTSCNAVSVDTPSLGEEIGPCWISRIMIILYMPEY